MLQAFITKHHNCHVHHRGGYCVQVRFFILIHHFFFLFLINLQVVTPSFSLQAFAIEHLVFVVSCDNCERSQVSFSQVFLFFLFYVSCWRLRFKPDCQSLCYKFLLQNIIIIKIVIMVVVVYCKLLLQNIIIVVIIILVIVIHYM